MDAAALKLIARETLGIVLTDAEAASFVPAYVVLQEMIRTLEEVTLPYEDDPFVTPATADAWLETWPDA